MRHKLRKIYSYLIILLIWIMVSLIVNDNLIFPKPSIVVQSLYSMFTHGQIARASIISVVRIFYGLIISTISGVALATFSYLTNTSDLFKPLISLIRSTPVVSFILFLMFFVSKEEVVYIVVFAISFPIMYQTIINTLDNQDPRRLELAKVYDLNTKVKLRYIYLPLIRQSVLQALSIAIGLSFKAGASAEVIAGANGGLGDLLYFSKLTFSAEDLFAVTIVIILLSFLFENVLKLISNKVANSD